MWRWYWPLSLVGIAAAELAIIVQFILARRDYHHDLEGPCFDECLSVVDMWFWGVIAFVWPFAALLGAMFIWVAVGEAWRFIQSRRSR